MRHWLPPLLVLALLIAMGAANALLIARCTDEWSEALGTAAADAQAEDWDAAREALAEVTRAWESRETLLRITVGHDTLDDIALRFTALHRAAEAEDGETFRAEAEELRTQLRLLREAEALSIRNIL